MSWNFELFLEILEIIWNLVDAPEKFFIIGSVIFVHQAIFLYTVNREVLG